MRADVDVRPVAGRRDRATFRDLPARLHAGHDAFVPMLDAALAAVLDRRRNPFWTHAEAREWIASVKGVPVGRIGACVDRDLLARAPGCGVVGFLDAPEDPAAARALFATAEAWLRERGCTRARGPLNYSIHDTAGVLVDGSDAPPTVDTTWNPPYVPRLWEENGWRGARDMLGAAGNLETGGPERARRFAERVRRQGVSVRPLDFARFDADVAAIREVYNAAWDANWGHVPVGAAEFAYKAKDLKAVLDPDLVRLAEQDGRVVGFFLGLPDLNPAIARSGGRLLPLGWWRLIRAKRTARRVRVLALGVVPGHRARGVEALLLSDSFAAIGARYPWCEASWVLEDNAAMMNGLALYSLYPYKRWRLYEKGL